MAAPNYRRDIENIAAGRQPVGDGMLDGMLALAQVVLALQERVERANSELIALREALKRTEKRQAVVPAQAP